MAKLKKFRVSYTEKVYYLTTEIKAIDQDEAEIKFRELFDNGEIVVNETECEALNIEEVK